MTAVITKFIGFFKNVLGFLLPDSLFNLDFVLNFNGYVEWLIEFLMDINFFIPVSTVFLCIGWIVTIKIVKFQIFFYNWLLTKATNII